VLDVAIRGGDVVDGTGAERRRADVGIRDGRVVEIGAVTESARADIDASGRIVAPGFVDIHTHIDAQVFWDPALTPSSLHGVTTMLAGNCGFTLAPLDDEAAAYLVPMLSVVEVMPLAALEAGVPADWRTTGEYLDRIDGTLALNAGFSVGHSALRRVVMGDDANRRAGTAAEVERMADLLRDGLAAGGLGFSSSWGVAHVDASGDPVPSRLADLDELRALAAVCADFDGTALEFIPPRVDAFGDVEREVLTALTAAAKQPLNWNIYRVMAQTKAAAHALVAATNGKSQRHAQSGRVVGLTMPIPSRARFSFATGFVLEALPGWHDVMRLPLDERRRALMSLDVRARLAASAATNPVLAEIADWGNRVIAEVFDESLADVVGRRVDDLAAERDITAFDALLDIVCADDLRTLFTRPETFLSDDDWRATAEVLREGGMIIGGSDAGAHLDFTAYFDYPVYVLEHGVRNSGVLALEDAVAMLTSVPARLAGLRARGELHGGSFADIVVFDEHTVGSGPMQTRFDLPTGAGRLYAEPAGIDCVLVNGRPVVSAGAVTGATPGTLLRSGRDTTGDFRR
jgi:N-acyl-D-aspartate/D-glutamate deacylase